MLFPVIKSHLTGSPVEIFLYPGMRGMLASVFLLGSLQLFVFVSHLGTCRAYIYVAELTSKSHTGSISVMFLKWFFNHGNVSG